MFTTINFIFCIYISKMEFLTVLLVLISAQSSFAQVPWHGKCPNIQPVPNFDTTLYAGTWFEAERYFFLPEIYGSCISLNYTLLADGSLDTQIRFRDNSSHKKAVVLQAKTSLIDSGSNTKNVSGNLQLSVELQNLNTFTPTSPLSVTYNCRIVATDYATYAIHWSCYNLFPIHFKSVWVLSRDPTYPEGVRRAVRAQLDSLMINKNILWRSDQNCIAENPSLLPFS